MGILNISPLQEIGQKFIHFIDHRLIEKLYFLVAILLAINLFS